MDPTLPPGQQLPSQQFLDSMHPQVTPPQPHKSFITGKKIAVLVVIFLIFAGGIALLSLQAITEKNFQAYAPTKLPAGIKLSGHITGNIASTLGQYKIVTISTNTPNFSIGEEKSSQAQYDATAYSCQLKLSESNCTSLTTPGGQSYDVRTGYDDANKPTTESVAWLKNETRFWISLSKDQVGKYTSDSWGNIIDSFQTVSYGSQ